MVLTRMQLEKLLHSTKDNPLYDEWNGIRAEAMQQAGFYTKYLTYDVGQKHHRQHASNWANTRTTFRDPRSGGDWWRVFHWTFWPGLPTPERHNLTHVRGLFVSRQLKVVIVYEPRKLLPRDIEKGKRRMYNRTHSDICRYFGDTYRFVTVFGGQVRSWDCEKRVIRFGMCSLPSVAHLVDDHGPQNVVEVVRHAHEGGNKHGLQRPIVAPFE